MKFKVYSNTNKSKIDVSIGSDDLLSIEPEADCDGSTEALALGQTGTNACDLTRGYLAGTTSALTRKRYHCHETNCVSSGNRICNFELMVREG